MKNLAPSKLFKSHLPNGFLDAVKLVQLSFLVLLLGLGAVKATAQCTCPGNLITNPSFETQDFSGWTLDTNDPGQTSFAGDATYAVCGTYYAYFNPTAGNSTDYVAYYQNITVTVGDLVSLTVYAGVHDPSKNHELRLQFFNASNTLLSGGQIIQVDNDVDNAPMTLQQYSLSGTAPAGTSYARVTAYCEGAWSGESTALKVDGFCMTKTAGSSCTLTGTGLNNVTCYPNGTATNPADDQIVFSLNPTGTGLGASYTVTVSSGTVSPTTATYGSTKWFRLNGGSAGAGNVTVTVTDVNGGGCTTASVITDPGSCVYSCGTNLLVNPSFETDALNTSPPTGWSCSGAGAFVGGNNMDEPDGTKYGFDNGAGTLCQDVAATTGQTFSLTFFSGSHNPSGVQTVTMRYLDSGGATLGTPATHIITFDTDNFTPQILGGPYSLSLPAAPAGTASVRVEVSNGGLDFAKVDAFCMTSTSTCTQPSAPTFTQVAPTCNGSTPQNNGTITLTAVTNGTHFGVSTLNAGSYDGPTTIATATAISLPQLIKNNIPNTGGNYIVRIFNGADGCFIDRTVTVAAVSCNAPSCSCSDYLYLNDIVNNITHKFKVEPSGSLTEIGSPWLSTGISLPHGIAMDPNGYIYIAEISPDYSTSTIKKLTVDGVILDANWLMVNFAVFNFFGTDEGLFLRNSDAGSINVYDWCSAAQIGCTLDANSGWGLSKSLNGVDYFATVGFQNSVSEEIIKGNSSLSNFGFPACTTTITPFVNPTSSPASNRATMGVTEDEDGNVYTVINLDNNAGGPAFLQKYNASGTLLLTSATDNTYNAVGYYGAWGLTYSAKSGYLYVSTLDDCIAVFDKNLNYISGLSVPNVPGNYPKAIGIIEECCPVPLVTSISQSYCNPQIGQKIYLRDFLPCDHIPAGEYSITGSSIGTYNSCDQSLTLTTTTGSTQFIYHRPPGANNNCGESTITVSLNLTSGPSAPTFAQVAPGCSGSTPLNNGTITLTAVTNGTHFGVSTLNAGSYDGPTTIATATAITLPQLIKNSIPNTGGTYIVRIFNGADDCFIDQVVTVASVTCSSSCTQPSAPTFTQVAPTCSGTTPQNNGTITLTAVTNGTHFGVSTLNAGSYDGPTTIAMATSITLPQLIKNNIPNTGGTYIVRIFNGADGCYVDQTVTVAAVTCNCPTLPCAATTVLKN